MGEAQAGKAWVKKMKEIPKPYEVYRHFKGNLYQIVAVAADAETGRQQVVYQAMYDTFQIYVRSLEDFLGKVDRAKYPDVSQEIRFVKSGEKAETPLRTEKEDSVPQSAEPMQTEEAAYYDAEEVLDPLLIQFLDADTYEEKLNLLVGIHHRLTQDMINTMAMAMDVEIAEGNLEDRYQALKNCLTTLQRYECSRLR